MFLFFFFFALKRTGKAFIMFRFKHKTVYYSALQNRTQAYSHKHNQCVHCCLAESTDVKHEQAGFWLERKNSETCSEIYFKMKCIAVTSMAMFRQ